MPKKLTQEEFIERARRVHGDKCDYSLVDYQGANSHVDIICPIHGAFRSTPHVHLTPNHKCPQCAYDLMGVKERISHTTFMGRLSKYPHIWDNNLKFIGEYSTKRTKILVEDKYGKMLADPNSLLKGFTPSIRSAIDKKAYFTNKANEVHNNRYDYSRVRYANASSMVDIHCNFCGILFAQRASSHLCGTGCPSCGILNMKNKITSSTEEFILNAISIHGDKYDYDKSNYINSSSPLEIWCNTHKVAFTQTPTIHLRGSGCALCGNDRVSESRRSNTEEFISKAKNVHGTLYDYSLVDYTNSEDKVIIICKQHGQYHSTPQTHLRGSGCPICKNSKGELAIHNYLIKESITFEREYTFPDCKNILPLPFDFHLPKYSLCIEYDGRQHFESIKYWGGLEEFAKIQLRDSIKTKFCKDTGIKLIRIPYTEFDSIEAILEKELC